MQDERIEGIGRKLTRTLDNHNFALWQAMRTLREASLTADVPNNVALLRGALSGMGYRPAEVNHAVSALRIWIVTEPLATLVSEALGVLAIRLSTSGFKPPGR